MNEFGDGMYSEIIEAQTKGKLNTFLVSASFSMMLLNVSEYDAIEFVSELCAQAADGGLDFRVIAPTASPSEQSTSTGKKGS